MPCSLPLPLHLLSAQRLAASEVVALRKLRILHNKHKCSTPCGIRGCGITRTLGRCQRGYCAQRLAASEVVAYIPENIATLCAVLCSTPCGIRGCGMPTVKAEPEGKMQVLNALRHQRLWHQSQGEMFRVWIRAQRLAASEVVASKVIPRGVRQLCKCSTPCGIRGCGIFQFVTRHFYYRWSAQRLAASEVVAYPEGYVEELPNV